jgi:hypothetical protein
LNAEVPDFAGIDIAEKTQIPITGAGVIYGYTCYFMVVSIKNAGKGRAVKFPIGIIDIRGNNGGRVGSPGQIDIGLQVGEARPVNPPETVSDRGLPAYPSRARP